MSPVREGVGAELYAEVQQFYARQMQALDGGRFAEYAATFTADGTFQHTPGTEPAVGPAGVEKELEAFHERFRDDPVQRRHYFNQIVLEPLENGDLRSTVYALIVRVRPQERPEVWPSCVVHDVVAVTEQGIRLRSRSISYDQLS
ncbi:nuclear transport factor 2 family protein [Kitasatospora sp. NPDC059827]|uniref:nuclear transport factor 2 family protein n=1 Tax=Kitasatospora sp. NPDC059827 TaxID=3346964 RepID=UPI00366696F6